MEIKRFQLIEPISQYVDKYFSRTKYILERENINPVVTMKVFCRGTGKNLFCVDKSWENEITNLFSFCHSFKDVDLWISKKEIFENNEPLMIIKSPIQNIIEFETLYLGILSTGLSICNGYGLPDEFKVIEKFKELKKIYKDISMYYFGARHYHYSLDSQIGKLALYNGFSETSTDAGSISHGKTGIGSMPHILPLIMEYYKGNGTLEAYKAFDKYMDKKIPRVVLVDTFNREITDSLAVLKYVHEQKDREKKLNNLWFRLDTCGENYLEYCMNQKGVTTIGVLCLRRALEIIRKYRTPKIMLSSGFGNVEKAREFADINELYKYKFYGTNLFDAVGIGEIYPSLFCTSDIVEIEGKSFSKVGRECDKIDYSEMEKIL
jgi:nicotinate phosphoribosyltransferase